MTKVNLEAAAILMSVEKYHSAMNKEEIERWLDSLEKQSGKLYCSGCKTRAKEMVSGYEYDIENEEWPCYELNQVRSIAFPETLEYVQIHLALEKGRE